MSYAIGQTITTVISLRDNSNVAITGLLEDDFATLESYLISSPGTTVLVALEEINEGQYALQFVPDTMGTWALHYVYDDTPVFLEDTSIYEVQSTPETAVTAIGGSWTYTGDLTNPIQEVRFTIQDIDSTYPLFSDGEIQYALDNNSNNVINASLNLLNRLATRYSQMADTTELDLSVRASQLFENVQALISSLGSAGVSSVPYAGGISYNDIQVNNANPDRVASTFDRQRRWPSYGGIVRPG